MCLPLKSHQFQGVSLGGGKTSKTCVSLIEYYPHEKNIFLKELTTQIKLEGEVSADEKLLKLLKSRKTHSIAINSPLKLPKCLRCRLTCPGYENCTEEEIVWLWKHYRDKNKKKKPKKLFTPYTERCTEFYISHFLEKNFSPSHALGSNMAPLTARSHYLARHLPKTLFEFHSQVSLWRIGRSLGISDSNLMSYKHSMMGKDARKAILKRFMDKDLIFLYQQDYKILVHNNNAFESFIGALTGLFKFQKKVENKPKDFPRSEGWIVAPQNNLTW